MPKQQPYIGQIVVGHQFGGDLVPAIVADFSDDNLIEVCSFSAGVLGYKWTGKFSPSQPRALHTPEGIDYFWPANPAEQGNAGE